MSRIEEFEHVVMMKTGGDPSKAMSLNDYITEMGIVLPTRRMSARAQVTKEMKEGGSLRHLIEQKLVRPNEGVRTPKCFEDVEIDPAPSTLPVVITHGPIADLAMTPDDHLSPKAVEYQKQAVQLFSNTNMPLKAAEQLANAFNGTLLEVERQTIRADSAELLQKKTEEMYAREVAHSATLQKIIEKITDGRAAA